MGTITLDILFMFITSSFGSWAMLYHPRRRNHPNRKRLMLEVFYVMLGSFALGLCVYFIIGNIL